MATRHEIVGEEWQERSRELADWAMERLMNRKDAWGQYSVLSPSEQRKEQRTYKAMTLPRKSMRGKDMVTLDKLARHFASRRHHKPQIIGLHAKGKDDTSRWLGIDIDCHDLSASTAEDHARRNLLAAIAWWQAFQGMGYDPLLFDSSGAGGYHLWVLFQEPAPTEDVFALSQAIVSSWEYNNLDEEPETFPKRLKKDRLGSWFRLPGLHHTRDHYSRVWSGDDWLSDPWLEGHAAIDAMLQAIPGPAPPKGVDDTESIQLPAKKSRTTKRSATTRKRAFKRKNPPTICVDLDGVLASRDYGQGAEDLGDPIDGAVEFTRELSEFAQVIILTSRLSGDSQRKAASLKKMEARIRAWLDEHGFSYADIHTDQSKPPALAYVDDRAVRCRPAEQGLDAFAKAQAAVRSLCDED